MISEIKENNNLTGHLKDFLEAKIPTESTRRFFVMSSGHFHGTWEVILRFTNETTEIKQDFADALLEEAFYLGWDYGDDWLPIMSRVTPSVIFEWRLNKRDGLIIPSYAQNKLWLQLFDGVNMKYKIHETKEDLIAEASVMSALSKQLGRSVLRMGSLSGWDGVLPGVNSEKPEMIFEIKCRQYSWKFFLKEGLILNKRKWEGLLQQFKAGVKPILVVKAGEEIRWVDVSRVLPDHIGLGKAQNDRYDTPFDEDVVVIDGSVFRSLVTLKGN